MNIKKPSLPNINFVWLNWLSIAVLGLVCAVGYVNIAWDLFAPMFSLPQMNVSEAIGVVLILAPFVALVVGLRETKSV
jgi:membrane protein YdbS with pleckstrin-like domain